MYLSAAKLYWGYRFIAGPEEIIFKKIATYRQRFKGRS